ncbi:DUF397 domain-containing protein [Streptomyces sp. NPDC091280]|uniref:DUF397 domain-containing protein n=1 Tax=Streptomyces sp. NPDC091280 TaxID=3365984 RepID=UPI00380BD017
MAISGTWRKSSYSGAGDGNSCVEIASDLTRVAIRDSKTPTGVTLTLPAGAFSTFVQALRGSAHGLAKEL